MDAFYEPYAEMLIFRIPTTEVAVCSIDSSYVLFGVSMRAFCPLCL